MPEPLPIAKLSNDGGTRFVRKITRRRHWEDPLAEQNAQAAAQVFEDEQEQTSVWRVESDVELRRIALAMNEARGSLHEELILLPISPAQLDALNLVPVQSAGITACPIASGLHFELNLDQEGRIHLATALIQAGVHTVRCTKPEMRAAEAESQTEGCLTIMPGANECLACGANRQ